MTARPIGRAPLDGAKRFRGGPRARQRRPALRVLPLPVADEGLDDFQRRAGFPLSAPPFEIRRQLAVRAQDLLIAHLPFASAVSCVRGVASFDHAVGSSPLTMYGH